MSNDKKIWQSIKWALLAVLLAALVYGSLMVLIKQGYYKWAVAVAISAVIFSFVLYYQIRNFYRFVASVGLGLLAAAIASPTVNFSGDIPMLGKVDFTLQNDVGSGGVLGLALVVIMAMIVDVWRETRSISPPKKDLPPIPPGSVQNADHAQGPVQIGPGSKVEFHQHFGSSPPTAPPGPAQTTTGKFDISRIIKYAPVDLIGREAETTLLAEAWAKTQHQATPRPHVLTLVALGGEGKTSLVAKWAAELAGQDWPGCETAFAWSFYSQGTRDQTAVSSDTFLKEALIFFGDAAMAASAQVAFEKGRRLAQLVGEQRSLLILDGLEPLQYAPTSPTPGELKDQGIAALLKGLAAASCGLCIVTTRYSIPDLRAYRQTTAPEEKLPRLSREAGVALLQSLGVKGSRLRNIPFNGAKEMVNEYEKLVEDVKGHALTLNLLGTYLRDAHAGDIRKRDLVKLEEADAENEHQNHAFHVIDAYVKWLESGTVGHGKRHGQDAHATTEAHVTTGRRAVALLRLLGLFDRPATADCLEALWKGEAIGGLTDPLIGIGEPQRNLALKRLEDAKLLTVNRDAAGTLLALDAHPLVREYFGERLKGERHQAWRAAHRRLYEHLCKTTVDKKPQPTLEDLQPLYQAVAHGCQAGLQQEAREKVYCDRILRGTGDDGFYSTRKLGAFGSDLGAVACFFEKPWDQVSPVLTEAAQAWLLNEAATRLRGLGRLTEALEPMRAGLEMRIKQEVWKSAAIIAGNLSELELTLGDVAGAVADGEQSVTYADRSGDAGMRMFMRTTHGDALHQAGRRAEAREQFGEAETMQAKNQPEYPLLYSGQGFQYCDLLLAEAEREGWRHTLNPKSEMRNPKMGEACRAVAQRAAQTLKWEEGMHGAPILDFALHHLTLGRAALYGAILETTGLRDAPLEIEAAVDGLRRAGQQQYLPLGLLTRAWLRCRMGEHKAAQADLDEAGEIAERGGMKLLLADIHLYRARLFLGEGRYPWDQHPDGSPRGPKDDLAEAGRLIEVCGYGRRKEELQDAEAAGSQTR